jgi:hypothetical protein
MNSFSNTRRILAAGAIAAGLTACGGDGSESVSGTGTLRLALTDAPACGFDEVNVTVQAVRVHRSATAEDIDSGWQTLTLDTPLQVDLLTLTNGQLLDLGEMELPAGRYNQLRLVLADNSTLPMANSVLPTNGPEVALSTPSAQQSGLKLKVAMDVAPEQVAGYVIDFDACRSVVKAGGSGNYLLKPVLSVLPLSTTGVAGEVALALVGPDTTVALQNNGVTVRSSLPAANGSFLLQPVPAGNYTFVLQSPGRATTVVEAVTVSANQVARLHPQGMPLNPSVSPTGTLSGTVNAASLPDALVRVLQPLTGGPVVELISRPVDGSTGAYSYTVSTVAPLRALYAGGNAMTFNPDATAAGKFSLEAQFDGAVDLAESLTLSDGGSLITNFSQP